MEKWVDIKGYEGLYQISDMGNVKVLPRRFKNKSGRYSTVRECIKVCPINHRGYHRTQLTDKNKNKKIYSVHRIVAQHFLPNPFNHPEVNHKNGLKTDNRATEIEWCTKAYNEKHALETGLKPKGSKSHKALLDETQVLTIVKCRHDGLKSEDIAKYFKVSKHAIIAIMSGSNWGWLTGINA